MEMIPLPHTTVAKIVGLLKVLDEHAGREDIYKLAKELHYELGELMEVIKAGEMLGFVHTPGGDAVLEDLGKTILKSKVNTKKKLFRDQLKKVALMTRLIQMLYRAEDHRLDKEAVLEELSRLLPHEDPEKTFETLVNWSRYGELFGYTRGSQQLYLDHAE